MKKLFGGMVLFVGERLRSLTNRVKLVQLRHFGMDFALISFSYAVGLWLRAGGELFGARLSSIWLTFATMAAVQLFTLVWFGVYDIIWRYISLNDAIRLAKTILLSAALAFTTIYVFHLPVLTPSEFIFGAVLVLFSTISARFFRRYLYERNRVGTPSGDARGTIIYGAGSRGRAIARRLLLSEPELGYRPIGFLDDDAEKVGRRLDGLLILGTGADLERILRGSHATEIIVAVANPKAELLQSIVQIANQFNIQPRLLKTHVNRTAGGNINLLRDLDFTDLLKRKKREMDRSGLAEMIEGKTVLVTGAGGSIGSELARQLFELGPAKLLLLDHSEYNLYQIDQELRGNSKEGSIVPLLVNVKSLTMLEQAFEKYRPEIVFHAAAYKHVHLVELNPCAAILNNVLGTRNLLDLSQRHNVKNFVLISTDKAVNPVGVMGATKRLCELMVVAAALRSGERYVSVRFGNVLGSSGSFIPALQERIRNGQSINITHPEMKRFFMLIPEAVSLVLRAATLARSGEIMVLKMGDAIRIEELAKSLLLLMGKTEKENPIIYTGMRPGEKLAEELYITGAEEPTCDPDVLIVPRGDLGLKTSDNDIQLLEDIVSYVLWEAQHGNQTAVERMMKLIKEGPSHSLLNYKRATETAVDDEMTFPPPLPPEWKPSNLGRLN